MRPARKIGRTPLLVGCVLAALIATVTASAFASVSVRKSAARTFTLRPGATRGFSVAYPDALEFSGARYSGSVTIIVPRGAGAGVPRARNVRILSRGSSEGGSLFTVRVRNGNPAGSTPVRIRVTATTVT
jgi:hypothetical protein